MTLKKAVSDYMAGPWCCRSLSITALVSPLVVSLHEQVTWAWQYNVNARGTKRIILKASLSVLHPLATYRSVRKSIHSLSFVEKSDRTI